MIYSDISEEIKNGVVSEYSTHSVQNVATKFSISKFFVKKILSERCVPLHTNEELKKISENEKHPNGYSIKRAKIKEEFLSSASLLDKEDVLAFYSGHADDDVALRYNVPEVFYKDFLSLFGLEKHTGIENKRFRYERDYGSYERGIDEETKRSKQTRKERYGDENFNNQKKRCETNINKYGSECPLCNEEIKEKAKSAFIEKYGVDNPFKVKEIQDRIHEQQRSLYGGVGFQSEELSDKYRNTMLERYGVEYGCLLPQAKTSTNGCNSGPNKRFSEALDRNGINYEIEFVIGSYRYDFRSGTILIEIDPTYTHSTSIAFRGQGKAIPTDYHFLKSQAATEAGYHCIHVFDWDDEEKIINLLKDHPTVYARKCEIRKIDKQVEADFLNAHHLQGYSKSIVAFGLFYNNELVSVMTFCKPRYNRNYQWELLRYCSSYNVIGGAEKLFSHFIKEYSPESIVSYCDVAKFKGDVYSKLGFTLKKKNKPSIHWFSIKTGQHITDNFLRQRGFDQLFGTNYGKGTSNKELMLEAGFVEVYDAGQNTYTWTER